MTTSGAATTGADQPQVGGPAAVAGALRALDRHARSLVKHGLAQQSIGGASLAAGVGEQHDHLARLLHEISLEHGTDAMSTAAEYASAALEAGSLYFGDELDQFLRQVAASVRTTSRELTKNTPFGS
jgi:hypothetical protein